MREKAGGWSDAYEVAADALARAEQRKGSLKGILYSLQERAGPSWKSAYAIAFETQRFLDVLNQAIESCEDLKELSDGLRDRQLWWTLRVLSYDALIGSGRKRVRARRGSLSRAVSQNLKVLRSAVEASFGGPWASRKELLSRTSGSAPESTAPLLRFVRVNLIKTTTAEARLALGEQGLAADVDPDLDDLLVLPAGTDLHAEQLVVDGAVILQDKGSCMAAAGLKPEPDWLVLDACAAPGNKTTHLASMLSSKGTRLRPAVLALDKDKGRFRTLQKRVEQAGAGQLVRCLCRDFLSVDPSEPPFCDVDAVLLDPSCSGSGLRNRADVSRSTESETSQRIEQLVRFQKKAVKHALSFPNAKVVSYSTCSIHREENEDVVAEVLGDDEVARSWELVEALPKWRSRGLPDTFPEASKCVRTDPDEHRTNGFFMARLQRREGVDSTLRRSGASAKGASDEGGISAAPALDGSEPVVPAKKRSAHTPSASTRKKRRKATWKRGVS